MTIIELVYFSGCPHVEAARENLRVALEQARLIPQWMEWDQLDTQAPDRVQGYGSPTVLVDGRDVSGDRPGDGAGCRTAGAPSVEIILAAIGGPV